MPTISGQDTQAIILKNGTPVGILNVVSYEVTNAGEQQKRDYLGENKPREIFIDKGWTGRVTVEIEDSIAEATFEEQIERAENNQDQDIFGIQLVEKFPNGSESRFTYAPATIKIGTNNSSRTERVTKTIEFSAADRKKVS